MNNWQGFGAVIRSFSNGLNKKRAPVSDISIRNNLDLLGLATTIHFCFPNLHGIKGNNRSSAGQG